MEELASVLEFPHERSKYTALVRILYFNAIVTIYLCTIIPFVCVWDSPAGSVVKHAEIDQLTLNACLVSFAVDLVVAWRMSSCRSTRDYWVTVAVAFLIPILGFILKYESFNWIVAHHHLQVSNSR